MEYYDAERYARINFEILTKPIDNETLDIGNYSESLAIISYHLIQENGLDSGDIAEAEMFARKAIRVKEKTHGVNYRFTMRALRTLSSILQLQGKNIEEVRDISERCLAINITYDSSNKEGVTSNDK